MLGGCGIMVMLFMVACVGSYYSLMHTSMPMVWIKRALEEDGNVRIEGLRGTINSGVEIDRLEFQGESDRWNELRDIKFKFNGFVNLARTKRLIIKEASVGGGTIYAEFDEEGDGDIDADINPEEIGEEIADEIGNEIEDFQREMKDGNLDELNEFRVDKIQVTNLKIVNPQTETTLAFDNVEFKNFQMLSGVVTSLGDLNVASDQLDLESSPSTVYADEKVAWNLTGRVKQRLHKKLTTDLPFDIDFAFAGKKLKSRMILCDGQIKLFEPWGDKRKIQLLGFSPTDYLELDNKLVPTSWNLIANIETIGEAPVEDVSTEDSDEGTKKRTKKTSNKDRTIREMTIEPGSSFQLGNTLFEIETEQIQLGPGEKVEPAHIIARGEYNSRKITARLSLLEGPPFVSVSLSSADKTKPKDLWAQLFFQSDYANLDNDQESQVDRAVAGVVKDKPEPVDF